MDANIKRGVAAFVAVAALVGVNFGVVEVDAMTEGIANAGAAVLGVYALARTWLMKFL